MLSSKGRNLQLDRSWRWSIVLALVCLSVHSKTTPVGLRSLQEAHCDATAYESSVKARCDELRSLCHDVLDSAAGFNARSSALCSQDGACLQFSSCIEEELKRTECSTDPKLSKGLADLRQGCVTAVGFAARNISCNIACEGSPSAPDPIANPGDTLQGGGTYSVRRSNAWELLTVVRNSTPTRWLEPCARSYSGYEWEVVQPRADLKHKMVQIVSCDLSKCRLKLPDSPYAYHVVTRGLFNRCTSDDPNAKCWRDRAASHLLMQGTFGPTRKDIASLSSRTAEDWVLDQIETQPATLHRAYYRRRANPRLGAVSEVGRPRGACEPHSRWNGIAIRGDDLAQNISFRDVATPGGGNVTAMYVGGVLRSEVDLSDLRPYGLGAKVGGASETENCNWCQDGALAKGATYVVCRAEEWKMGLVVIGTRCTGDLYPSAENRVELYNVPMRFDALPYPAVDRLRRPIELLELSKDDDVTIYELPATIYNEGVLIVAKFNIACPFSLGAQVQPFTTIKKDGNYYRYDPRLVLLDNEIASPMDLKSTSVDGSLRTCPLLDTTAPKTGLNEDSCIVTHGCLPDKYTSNAFELNETSLRAFFLHGNNFVYAVDSLPSTSASDPCTRKARWRSLTATQCAGSVTTSLSNDTATVLADAIRSSPDANRYVRDIQLSNDDRKKCSGAKEAVIDVDGQCWEHTHDDQLSVYDFSLFAMDHGGNNAKAGYTPIKQVAFDGKAVIHFPSWHPISRWNAQAGGSWTAIGEPFGRYGDNLTLAALPRRVRSAGLAEALGVGVQPAFSIPGQEICGSPGEVANDPTLGGRYYFGKERYSEVAAYSQQEILENYKKEFGDAKQTVWTMAAFRAPDQLRQRVAWALAKTFVISHFSSAVLNDHVEVWTGFHDIFVRHAFGNYRDVMREVSYNPVMARYLTFLNSASWAYSGSVPDENYAREVMQLFSIGLWEQELDGTPKMGADGQPVPTYVNDNIVEFARCWTGFDDRGLRGNLEQKRISQSNQVDPMMVRPERRDAFPKMDLHRGHIGDAYPLCTDLQPLHFLRVGAKYRYLGRTGVPEMTNGGDHWDFGSASTSPDSVSEPIFAPDVSASALYAALCDADASTGKCRFRSTVVLKSNLVCHGGECGVETLRVVKIVVEGESQPFFFEYVPIPCVSLIFFAGSEGGKYIENVNNIPSHDNDDSRIEKVCADPLAHSAAPGCCNPDVLSCFEYRCNYVEERVTYNKAIERCQQTVWPSPFSPAPPPPAGNIWHVFPHDYQVETSACPAGSTGPSEEECMAAATAAMAAAAEPHFDAPTNKKMELKVGSWGNEPSGCTIKTFRGDVRYNRASGGKASEGFKLVCNTNVNAADYRNASQLFCPRKRSHCWWKDKATNCQSGFNFGGPLTRNLYWWTEEACQLQAQINIDGRVAVVHPGSESVRRVGINSGNWFRVRWSSGKYPTAAAGCGPGCKVVAGDIGDTCLCDIEMTTAAAFTDPEKVPTQAEVEEELRIGAPPVSHFDADAYTLCSTPACSARSPAVKVYTRGGASSPVFDDAAIFEIVVNGTRHRFLANKRSVVSVSSSAFSFRNPPTFMTLVDPTQRDALDETEALLNHIFYHPNVAPFVAKLLIKHLVTSNPSPRYVKAVATAFRDGSYNGRSFSGRYGDLGAATAAVLLDREARSPVLAADPTHGQIREPILRLLHFLRAMEFEPHEHREVELFQDLIIQIGQAPYRAPNVFSFFRPEYSPEGPVQDAGLLAPEAQLGVLPYIIGFLDGASSLVFDGLSQCSGGFGSFCNRQANSAPRFNLFNHGLLSFAPAANASHANSVVAELDLLLTAGRLDDHARGVIVKEFRYALNMTSCPTDRVDLCGRLTPGDELKPGEHIVNEHGEVLCVTYDGVARHIDARGKEVFSNDYETKGGKTALIYTNNGELKMAGPVSWGWHNGKWSSTWYNEGLSKDVFHDFLSGPCKLLDQKAMDRMNVYGYATHGAVTQSLTCHANSTCESGSGRPRHVTRTAEYMAERAKTDARYALQVAQHLMAATAAFAVTNEPATTDIEIPLPPPRPRKTSSYKALVVLFMAGGADTFNLLVPHSQCDGRNHSEWYTRTRGAAALDLNSVLPIAVEPGQQPCATMGVHPEMKVLHDLWADGDASLTANVGALVEPVTVRQVQDREGNLPAGLFAHNLQTQSSKTLYPQVTTGKTGVVGRIIKAFADQAAAAGQAPIKASAYSITDDKVIFRGSPVEPVLLSSYQGMLTYEGSKTANRALNADERNASMRAFEKLSQRAADSIFAETYNSAVRASLVDSERISALLKEATLTKNWKSAISQASKGYGQSFVAQFEQVASVIASRKAFEAEVDVFYVELGGFDTHANVLSNLATKYRDINIALDTFVQEMKAQGVWENVAVQSLSEFGRTMTSNGAGTDHAWGGNHFLVGGDVKGGVIHGQVVDYPELRTDGPESVSPTGQMLPSSPWEAIWKPISQWLGVENDQLANVMPNIHAFTPGSVLERKDVFRS